MSNLANSLLNNSEATNWDIFGQSIYVIEGFCILVFNGLIVLTVYRHSALRFMKEYVCLAALAFADAFNGLGTLWAGVYRLSVWVSGCHTVSASGRYCLLTGHNMLWVFFSPVAHSMLVVLSLDRVFSVAIPLHYLRFTKNYMYKMVSIAYGICFSISFVICFLNWPNTQPSYTKVCWSDFAYGIKGSYIRSSTNTIFTLLSIALYLFVPIVYRYRLKKVSPQGSNANSRRTDFQKQLNKSVSASCVATFGFVALPWLVQVVFLSLRDASIYENVIVFMFIISNLNPACNLWIYYYKQHHFRVGFKALFKNKILPPNLDNWP